MPETALQEVPITHIIPAATGHAQHACAGLNAPQPAVLQELPHYCLRQLPHLVPHMGHEARHPGNGKQRGREGKTGEEVAAGKRAACCLFRSTLQQSHLTQLHCHLEGPPAGRLKHQRDSPDRHPAVQECPGLSLRT